ncbi:subtilisin-like protein [Canariomyces notabilis]|uniref:Subtilisin-like protein n=1 Tax=Canariomyces notabilis TaxID=2074819 RepID=A0AAN6T6J3_9PEZI|nr:subtilisin-like protein [Canariomyces arenarius]
MIFNWLTASNTTKVRKIIEVVVDDFEDAARPSHCDDAIVKCLKPFNIEAWDWRRMDIDSDVISRAAGDHVRVVNLYCSGLNAVLRSWSDREGLPSLKALEEVYLETHQGRESLETMERYVSKFEERLKENYKLCHGRELLVECAPVTAAPDDAAGGKKGGINTGVKNGRGREEEDWLLCMDEFSKFIQTCPPKAGSSSRTVTVALIDDGVQSSYDGLNVNIQNGESWAKAREFQWGKPGRRFRPTYYTSQHGHGTVMAWYIRRVCREVRLLVAKLDSVMAPRTPVTFSIESAAKAIDWAVKEGADIINMSWAIDMHEADRSSDKRYKPLKDAIEKAVKKNILLFCANPDKGSEEAEPKTFPKCLPGVTSLFCIGAAENGQRWMKISRNDETCDFFLPGVRLDIEAESRQGNPKGSKSFEQWKEFGGSSLACALASGLAAMILHCSQICDITNEQWAWLKSYNGMKAAFESLQVTSELWLPVRKVFGQPFVSKTDTPEKKRQRLREDVVDKHFLATMPKPEGKRR